jgi:hypothetical protein
MSDLPDDLIQLQRAIAAARAAVDEYAAEVSAARRAEFPDDEQIVERQTWTPEQDAELERLRAAFMAACRAKWDHPAVQQAEVEKTLRELDKKLITAARTQEPAAG